MKTYKKEVPVYELQIPLSDFLKYYNHNIPAGFPSASTALLEKFKGTHPTLFKHGDLWSLDQHRKKIIEWLPTQ
jgi:hypothetical protein